MFAHCPVLFEVTISEDLLLDCSTFERLCIHIDETINHVPLTFVLGFYVSFVVSRWWEQLVSYPWPDRYVRNSRSKCDMSFPDDVNYPFVDSTFAI
jgi:Bestrophin, RFP-TM, chloride channel